MLDLFDGLFVIVGALFSADSFEISEALNSPSAYLFGAIVAIFGG